MSTAATERNPLVEQRYLMEVWRLTVLGHEGGVIVATMAAEHGVPAEATRKLLRIVRARLHTVGRRLEGELVQTVRRQQLDRLTYAAHQALSTGACFAGDSLVAIEGQIARLVGTEAPKEHRVQMDSRSVSVELQGQLAPSSEEINRKLLEIRQASQGARAIAHPVDVLSLGAPTGMGSGPMSTVGLSETGEKAEETEAGEGEHGEG